MTIIARFKGSLKARVHPDLWLQLHYLRRSLRRKASNVFNPLFGRLQRREFQDNPWQQTQNDFMMQCFVKHKVAVKGVLNICPTLSGSAAWFIFIGTSSAMCRQPGSAR